jgi:hypothetical protein
LKVTRFCPTLYPGKQLHLGHLFSLAITLRWANRNDAKFFYLIELQGCEQLPDLPQLYNDPRRKNSVRQLNSWCGDKFSISILEAILFLQQIAPAPIATTLFSTVQEQDRIHGVTDVFRGSHCVGAYKSDQIEIHTLPMLTDAMHGYVDQCIFNDSLTVRGMMCRYHSTTQLELWAKAIRYTFSAISTIPEDAQIAHFSHPQWEGTPIDPAKPANLGGPNSLVAEIDRMLEVKS